ncbi:MAG: hypothetical protein LBJ57_02710 [Prevotellaceae bacterium]|jgi:hypothetical protein|nr:hypothetical protein [Prevotellaceae bacterium]
MANVYTIGLSKIEMGDVDPSGGMGTTLAQVGYTLTDSCSMTQEDPTVTDFTAEEVDDPVVSAARAGKTTFNFSVMNADVNVLAKLLGGTVDTAGDVDTWSAPDNMPVIEQSVKITPQQGLIFSIPRMKIVAKINGSFSKSNIFVIDVVGTVLQPTKAGERKMKATNVVAA